MANYIKRICEFVKQLWLNFLLTNNSANSKVFQIADNFPERVSKEVIGASDVPDRHDDISFNQSSFP